MSRSLKKVFFLEDEVLSTVLQALDPKKRTESRKWLELRKDKLMADTFRNVRKALQQGAAFGFGCRWATCR